MELIELILAGEKIMTVTGLEIRAKPTGNPFCVSHTTREGLMGEIECVARERRADGYSVGTPEPYGPNEHGPNECTPVQLYKILK